MNWNEVMGILSTITLFLPVILIVALRLYCHKSFPALLIYFFMVTFYNTITEGIITVSPNVQKYIGITINLLDAPLILTFLLFYTNNTILTKRIKIVTAIFIVFELVMISIYGMTTKMITLVLGPGILIILYFTFLFFLRQVKITIMHRKATGKALIIASILFAYGCYSLIYLLYYVFKTPYVSDTFLMYFIVTTFSSLLLSAGLIIEKKRIHKLSELKTLRKELSIVFGH